MDGNRISLVLMTIAVKLVATKNPNQPLTVRDLAETLQQLGQEFQSEQEQINKESQPFPGK